MSTLRRLFQVVLLCVLAWPTVAAVPAWFVATWVGCAWGALVLTGMIGSWANHRLVWILYSCLAAIGGHASLMQVLGIEHHQAWLIVCILLAAGWAIGKVASASQATAKHLPAQIARWPQLSMWDLATLTCCVALLCSIMPHIEDLFHLACQVAPAMTGGLVLSLLATQWAWRDHWTLSNFIAVLLTVLLAALLVVPYSVLGRLMSVELLSWMIVGPVAVITAQGTLVLAYLAVSRQNPSDSPLPTASA